MPFYQEKELHDDSGKHTTTWRLKATLHYLKSQDNTPLHEDYISFDTSYQLHEIITTQRTCSTLMWKWKNLPRHSKVDKTQWLTLRWMHLDKRQWITDLPRDDCSQLDTRQWITAVDKYQDKDSHKPTKLERQRIKRADLLPDSRWKELTVLLQDSRSKETIYFQTANSKCELTLR